MCENSKKKKMGGGVGVGGQVGGWGQGACEWRSEAFVRGRIGGGGVSGWMGTEN